MRLSLSFGLERGTKLGCARRNDLIATSRIIWGHDWGCFIFRLVSNVAFQGRIISFSIPLTAPIFWRLFH